MRCPENDLKRLDNSLEISEIYREDVQHLRSIALKERGSTFRLPLFSFLLAGIVLPSLPFSASGQALRFQSTKPLYARVALTPDQSTILRMAFDESRGTGTGYDTLYTTLHSNGRAGRVQRQTARTRRLARGVRCDFPPIKLNVPYATGSMRMSYPCELTIAYQKLVYPLNATSRTSSGFSGAASRTQESFSVTSTVTLRYGSDQWHYSFRGNLTPSQSLDSAPMYTFLQRPTITITTRPDGRNQGNTGIGLRLAAGENQVECKRGSAPTEARVEVKKQDGAIVHRGSGALDKFTFG